METANIYTSLNSPEVDTSNICLIGIFPRGHRPKGMPPNTRRSSYITDIYPGLYNDRQTD